MKNSGISAIRCVAMCMIVSCHFLQAFDNELAFWMNIGVQIFLCMSGYLYGGKKIECVTTWYKKQYFKIMKPLWILLTVLAAVILITKMGELSITALGLSYLGTAGFGTLPELTHTWFITYILCCYLITPLLQSMKLGKTEKLPFFILRLLFLLAVLEILYLSRIVNLLPQYLACYIVGYYFSQRQLGEGGGGKDIRRLTILVTGVALVLLPVRLYIQYGNLDIGLPAWDLIRTQITEWHHTVLGIALFFILLLIFDKRKPKYGVILRCSDKYSYCIYLVHQIFIMNTFSLLYITDFIIINAAVTIVVILLASFVLKQLTERVGLPHK